MSGSGTGSFTAAPITTVNRSAAAAPDQLLDQAEKESFISQVPNWIEVEELPWSERIEIQMYKLVSLIPVSVTFVLYIYLFIFYTAVSKFFLLSSRTPNKNL